MVTTRISRRRATALTSAAAALSLLGACGKKEFSIESTWRSTGTESWGLVKKGSVVSFDGSHCALFSPNDTYAFYKDGGSYRLDVTGALGSGGSFTVKVVDDDNIELAQGSTALTLTRTR
ncbi:hypothetical protein [Actinomyces israelii]|uniref:hypothetical protein n=1 Tax=Actinomyces israelii TaxID=1659 RepID=UPI0005BA0E5C|nr:hypothetical protein [Actinomyces israelii]